VSSLPHPDDSRQDNVIRFPGFEPPEQNYSKLPHALIDALPQFKTHGELAVVLYILRHTWGFSEFDTPKRISLGEFVKGRKRRDGTRLDSGCGMSLASVKRALKAAEEHGFIVSDTNASDPGRIAKSYKLNMAHAQNEPTLVQDEHTPVQNEPPSTNTPVQNEPSYIERNLEKDTEEKKLLAPADADAPRAAPLEVDAAIYGTPEKSKPERKRDELFDAVALHVFGIHDAQELSGEGGRIGAVTSWLKGKPPAKTAKARGVNQLKEPATPDEVLRFRQWYVKKNTGANVPKDIGKFAEHFLAYRQTTTRREAAAAIEFPAEWYPSLESFDYAGTKKESA